MAELIDMPKLSDTMTVGTLVKWLKQEGDAVKSGDMLAEIETDKATMELESFFDGTLLKIFLPAGSQAPIGTPLCAVGKPGEKVEAPTAKPAQAAPSPAKAPESAPAPAKAPESKQTSANDAPSPAKTSEGAPAAAPQSGAQEGRIRISPLARKLAAEKGIDPSRIAGSGPGGRIVRADVLEAGKNPVSAKGSSPAQPSGAVAASPSKDDQLLPVSNMRAIIARRLVESKTQFPHFYAEVEIDADALLELRAQLNEDEAIKADGVKLSVNDFILKAAAEALRRVPTVNSSWEGASIRRYSGIHVSFAVAIDDGLITPVIRDTHSKSLVAISGEARALAKRAKDKKLAPAEFTGGTFCVSNMGMLGVDRFCAIINPPNAAIVAVGSIVKKPVVKGDKIAIGQRMSLTLSCDHRVVDGATGAVFLAALKELLEKPALLLL